ncbi:MAG: phosphotransferase [Chloroflexi bacterium]|nr:phosphotransferase [Chloroflexota bacterium]
MLEKPNLPFEKIIACLRESYGIPVIDLDFLPIGYDTSASVYRVRTDTGARYFLKVKQGSLYEASVNVPHALHKQGLAQVVAPLPTRQHELWQRVDEYVLLLYPFLEGVNGMVNGLSDQQWVELGAFLQKLHTTTLSAPLLAQVPKETFIPSPKWVGIVKTFLATPPVGDHTDRLEQELAAFWQSKQAEIQQLVERTEALGRLLQKRSLPFVLCHADIHTANLLLNQAEQIFIVDWDQSICAPKERDLMFVIGSTIGSTVAAKTEALFLTGYGPAVIDWMALTYYRYEWVVQELGDFAERVFLMPELGRATKKEAVQGLIALFEPGDVVDVAYQADQKLSAVLNP